MLNWVGQHLGLANKMFLSPCCTVISFYTITCLPECWIWAHSELLFNHGACAGCPLNSHAWYYHLFTCGMFRMFWEHSITSCLFLPPSLFEMLRACLKTGYGVSNSLRKFLNPVFSSHSFFVLGSSSGSSAVQEGRPIAHGWKVWRSYFLPWKSSR